MSSRTVIRFVLIWIARCAAFLVLVLAVALLSRDLLLREWLLFRLRRVTGLEPHLSQVHSDLRHGRLTLSGLQLDNSADFGGGLLISVPELTLHLDTQALRRRELGLALARLHLAELNLVRNRRGETNLFVLRDTLEQRAGAVDALLIAPPGLKFGGIQELNLTVGTLRMIDLAHPTTPQVFHARVTNEVVRQVRTFEDLTPLLLRILVREISEGFAR